MAWLRISNLVPGDPEQVFRYVTAFPQDGEFDQKTMEEKYGQLLERSGNKFTFLENIGGGIKWECTFDPPNLRVMRAVDSTWSDRFDVFEPTEDGTLWTITWELKVTGLAVITQWLGFHLRAKSQVRDKMVTPVVSHFQHANGGS